MSSGVLQTCLSDAWGGLEMVAFELACQMKRSGYIVTTVCPPDSPLAQKLISAGLDVLPVCRRHNYISPSAVRAIRRALKSGRYGTVLVEQLNELWQVVPALWGMPKIRLVGISHLLIGVTKTDFLHRHLYHRMNTLIALTEIHRQNLLSHLPVNADAITVLPNAVNLGTFNPARRDQGLRTHWAAPDVVLIGVVSRLDQNKGLLEAIAAADRLRLLGLRFKLVIAGSETAGERGMQDTLEQAIATHRLENEVELIGHRSDIARVMATFDILLMPSPTETFGRVLIEAMASGAAIVAVRGGGVPDIIKHEDNGLLVSSVTEMTQALARLIRDPELRGHLVARGQLSVRELYDERVLETKLYQLLGL